MSDICNRCQHAYQCLNCGVKIDDKNCLQMLGKIKMNFDTAAQWKEAMKVIMDFDVGFVPPTFTTDSGEEFDIVDEPPKRPKLNLRRD